MHDYSTSTLLRTYLNPNPINARYNNIDINFKRDKNVLAKIVSYLSKTILSAFVKQKKYRCTETNLVTSVFGSLTNCSVTNNAVAEQEQVI